MMVTKKYFRYIPILFLIAFIFATYLPLIARGGIIADDWGDIAQNLVCSGFFDCYRSWFPLFSNRPLAPLPITVSTHLFGTHYSWYLILNTSIFIGSITLAGIVIRALVGNYPAIIFVAIASIPTIAMPLIVSPINQLTATLSLFYWAISLYLLLRFLHSGYFISYIVAYALLLCSLLTYEVMLPLLAFTALLPYAYKPDLTVQKFWNYCVRYFLPIAIVLFLAFIWQKVVAPQLFLSVFSRLNFDPNNIFYFTNSWLSVFYDQIPALFIKSKSLISSYFLFTLVLLYLALFFSTKKESSSNEDMPKNWSFLCVGFLCLLGSPLLFILSGAPAESWGYPARALSSTWIALAIFIAGLAAVSRKIKWPYLLTLSAFGFFNLLSFSIQRDNYIKSWQTQVVILHNAIELITINNIPPNATILGNVPRLLPEDFNQEIIFSAPWDFGAALAILTDKRVGGAAVIDTRKSEFHQLKLEDGVLTVDNWWKARLTNLWFYDFNPITKIGSLKKIDSLEALQNQLLFLGYLGDIGTSSNINLGEKINFAIDWQDRSEFIRNGWAEREAWGGIWSISKNAQLRLPLPVKPAKNLKLNVRAFVNEKKEAQKIFILVNGVPEKSIELTHFDNNEIDIPISTALSKLPFITIDFQFPDATSPKKLGIGEDDRILGIGLKSAQFF
jgi:hypothetical protein